MTTRSPTRAKYISLLRRVRAVVPRSALRYDATLAQEIDAAIGDPAPNLRGQLIDAKWGDRSLGGYFSDHWGRHGRGEK